MNVLPGASGDPWAAIPPPTGDAAPVPSAAQDDFRDAMARLAGGVTVVTTRDPVGRDCGITATAVSSVSLAPPLVLVCVRRGSFVHDALLVSDGWAVSMLASDQVELARYAARHRVPGDRDDFSPWLPHRGTASGALVLPGAVAAVECLPYDVVEAGDHAICVGRVVAVSPDTVGVAPLVYVDRGYAGTDPLPPP